MDATTESLAAFAAKLTWDDIPADVRRAAEKYLFDSIGCAIGGYDTPTSKAARRLMPTLAEGPRGRVLAGDRTTSLEAAAFANGVMIRELDFNDYYPGGHPSDQVGVLLAVAEHVGADGRQLLTAMTIAYEIFIRLCKSAPLKKRGWDQGFGVCVGAAAALGNLMGLPQDVIAHGIAMSAVAHLPLRATKAGALSMWKGAATAHAARSTLNCVLLAAEGVTGPDQPFEGRDGVWQIVTDGPFQLAPFGTASTDFFTPETSIKYWPVCGGLLAPVAASIDLHDRGVTLDDIDHIDVATNRTSYLLNGSDAEKWDPQTRETADHSIPYAIVRVLADGSFEERALHPEEFLDARWRPLMERISVSIADDIEARYPEDIGARLTVTDRSGETTVVESINPPGHERNPLTTDQVRDKFRRMALEMYPEAQVDEIDAFWSTAGSQSDLTAGFELLRPR